MSSLANMRAQEGWKHMERKSPLERLHGVAELAQAASDAMQAAALCPSKGMAGKWATAASAWCAQANATLASLKDELAKYADETQLVRAVAGGATETAQSFAPLRLVQPEEELPTEKPDLERAAERWSAIRGAFGFRRDVLVPKEWSEAAKLGRRWAFSFHPREGGDVMETWIWEGYSRVNLTKHRVAPPQPDARAAREWAIGFARVAGFPPLEHGRRGQLRPLHVEPATDETSSS